MCTPYQRTSAIFQSVKFVLHVLANLCCSHWCDLGAHSRFETMATMRLFNVKLFKSVYKLKLNSVKGKSVKPFGD